MNTSFLSYFGVFPVNCCLQFVQLRIVISRVHGLVWGKYLLVDLYSSNRDQNFLLQEPGFSDRNGRFIPSGLGLFALLVVIMHLTFIYGNQSFYRRIFFAVENTVYILALQQVGFNQLISYSIRTSI